MAAFPLGFLQTNAKFTEPNISAHVEKLKIYAGKQVMLKNLNIAGNHFTLSKFASDLLHLNCKKSK